MDFVQEVIWRGTVPRHAAIGLAWRYGVVAEGIVEFTFLKRIDAPKDKSDRMRGKFRHVDTGKELELVVTKDTVVTALATNSRFQDKAAQEIKVMFETQDIWAPGSISLEEIVDIRNAYVDEGAPFDASTVRQSMKKLARSRETFSSELTAEEALEQLGLDSLFFEEVKSLRQMAREKAMADWDSGIDFDNPTWASNAGLEMYKRITKLGRREPTLLEEEQPGYWHRVKEEWEASEEYEEYMQESWQANIDEAKEAAEFDRAQSWRKYLASEEYQEDMQESWQANIDEAKESVELERLMGQMASATFGVPSKSSRELQDNRGRKVAEYSNALVKRVPSKADDDGWFYLGFTYDNQYYWVGTRFQGIIDTYALGDESVRVVFYGDLPFLHEQTL